MNSNLKARILVVEDEADLRKLLHDAVSNAGYGVTTATDGSEAISKVQADSFDLALLDIQMPNTSGIEVLKFIQQNCPNTRSIILTGYADLKNAMEAKEFGARDFIKKPYTVDDILRTIERVLAE